MYNTGIFSEFSLWEWVFEQWKAVWNKYSREMELLFSPSPTPTPFRTLLLVNKEKISPAHQQY